MFEPEDPKKVRKQTALLQIAEEMTGQTFGPWTVLGFGSFGGKNEDKLRLKVRCACGFEDERAADVLCRSNVTSYGHDCPIFPRKPMKKRAAPKPKPKPVKAGVEKEKVEPKAAPKTTRRPKPMKKQSAASKPSGPVMVIEPSPRFLALSSQVSLVSLTEKRLVDIWSRIPPEQCCIAWEEDFAQFANWALVNGFGRGKALHRLESDRPFHPFNCRWK